jgi:hypothetical protein
VRPLFDSPQAREIALTGLHRRSSVDFSRRLTSLERRRDITGIRFAVGIYAKLPVSVSSDSVRSGHPLGDRETRITREEAHACTVFRCTVAPFRVARGYLATLPCERASTSERFSF